MRARRRADHALVERRSQSRRALARQRLHAGNGGRLVAFLALALAALILGGAQVVVSSGLRSILGGMTIVLLSAVVLRLRPAGFGRGHETSIGSAAPSTPSAFAGAQRLRTFAVILAALAILDRGGTICSRHLHGEHSHPRLPLRTGDADGRHPLGLCGHSHLRTGGLLRHWGLCGRAIYAYRIFNHDYRARRGLRARSARTGRPPGRMAFFFTWGRRRFMPLWSRLRFRL